MKGHLLQKLEEVVLNSDYKFCCEAKVRPGEDEEAT